MRRRMVNTGQGRRRLNARAALRQVDFSYERSGSPGAASGGTSEEGGAGGTSAGAAAQPQQQGEAPGPAGEMVQGRGDAPYRRRSVSRRTSEGGTGRGRLARSAPCRLLLAR